MPIHEWTRARANRFHHFHQTWTTTLASALNRGRLPAGYFALAEQVTGGPETDVVALELSPPPRTSSTAATALQAPPKTRFVLRSEPNRYARKANRVTIRHPDGEVIAVIEIVSPGNKNSGHAIRSFARKAVEFLDQGIHLLIVDLFPPNRRNPQGIHKVIWDRICDSSFELPPDKPLTLAAYESGSEITAFVEPVAVGDKLPDMPIFLAPNFHVPCPLEETYQATWDVFPAVLKAPLEASA
jgi:hypothetical protein